MPVLTTGEEDNLSREIPDVQRTESKETHT